MESHQAHNHITEGGRGSLRAVLAFAEAIRGNITQILYTTLFVGSIIFIMDHGLHLFDRFNYLSNALARVSMGYLDGIPGKEGLSKSRAVDYPIIAYVDECSFLYDFNSGRPMPLGALRDGLLSIAAAQPSVLVVDINVAPRMMSVGDGGLAKRRQEEQSALEEGLGDIVAQGTSLVLLDPGHTDASPAAIQALQDWRDRMRDMFQRRSQEGGPSVEGAFASPVIVARDDQVHFFYARHFSLDRNGMTQSAIDTLSMRALTAQALANRRKGSTSLSDIEARWRHDLKATEMSSGGQQPAPQENMFPLDALRAAVLPVGSDTFCLQYESSQRIRFFDTKSGQHVAEQDLRGRAVFFGIVAHGVDRHAIDLLAWRVVGDVGDRQLDHVENLSGLELHAAAYLALQDHVKTPLHTFAFLIDMVVGVISGFLLGWVWKRYAHAAVASGGNAHMTTTRMFSGVPIRNPEQQGKLIASHFYAVLALIGLVLMSFAISVMLLSFNYWMSSIPIVIGIFLHGQIEMRHNLLHVIHHAGDSVRYMSFSDHLKNIFISLKNYNIVMIYMFKTRRCWSRKGFWLIFGMIRSIVNSVFGLFSHYMAHFVRVSIILFVVFYMCIWVDVTHFLEIH